MQTELTPTGAFLDSQGKLMQVGWSRQPLSDCNLEQACIHRVPLAKFLDILHQATTNKKA